jgi:hypothetical protein
MCTYLDQVGSTYYFRRVVPLELRAFIRTSSGAARAEWKISLRTKDRDAAKKRIPHFTIQTDKEIDLARHSLRLGLTKAPQGTPEAPAQALSSAAAARMHTAENAVHEAADIASRDADEREARYDAREDDRRYWERRMAFSTVDMTPREAAVKDMLAAATFNEEVAQQEIAFLRMSLAQAKAAHDPDLLAQAHRSPLPAPSQAPLLDMFDAYAKEHQLKANTAAEWRSCVQALITFLGHDDATMLTPENLDDWKRELLAGTTNKGTPRTPMTVRNRYFAAVRAMT